MVKKKGLMVKDDLCGTCALARLVMQHGLYDAIHH